MEESSDLITVTVHRLVLNAILDTQCEVQMLPLARTVDDGMHRHRLVTVRSKVNYQKKEKMKKERQNICVKIQCIKTYVTHLISCLFVVMQCRDPGIPEHAVRQGNSFTFESVLTYHCDVGYTRHGAATLVCGQSGRWTSSPPTCERKCQFMCFKMTEFCLLE